MSTNVLLVVGAFTVVVALVLFAFMSSVLFQFHKQKKTTVFEILSPHYSAAWNNLWARLIENA